MDSQQGGDLGKGRKLEKVAVPLSQQPCGRREGDDRVNVMPARRTVVWTGLGPALVMNRGETAGSDSHWCWPASRDLAIGIWR